MKRHGCKQNICFPRGDMPWPEPGQGRHARARAGAAETCPGQSRTRGVMPWPEPAQRKHARARAGPEETRRGQSRPNENMPCAEAVGSRVGGKQTVCLPPKTNGLPSLVSKTNRLFATSQTIVFLHKKNKRFVLLTRLGKPFVFGGKQTVCFLQL